MTETTEIPELPVDVTVATPDDRERVLRTIVAAFEDDPFLRLALPDADDYAQYAPEFFGTLFDRRVERTTVWLANGGDAVALWDPPGVPTRRGSDRRAAEEGEGGHRRLRGVGARGDADHAALVPRRARDRSRAARAWAGAGGTPTGAVARGIRERCPPCWRRPTRATSRSTVVSGGTSSARRAFRCRSGSCSTTRQVRRWVLLDARGRHRLPRRAQPRRGARRIGADQERLPGSEVRDPRPLG